MPRKETGVRISVDISKYVQLLRSVPEKIQRKAVMDAIRDGLRLLERAYKAVAPRKTGKTRREIKSSRVRQQGSVFSGRVDRPIIFNILEHGAKPHEIVPRRKQALAFNDVFAARVKKHPGFPGRPIFEPVTRANEAEVIRIFGQKVEQVVKEAVAGAR